MATVDELMTKTKDRMDKAINALRGELTAIRTGRATPSLLDRIKVDYYGTPTPINQVANISVPEPRMMLISPWEKSMIKPIEKAIQTSDLGINPNTVKKSYDILEGRGVITTITTKRTFISEDTKKATNEKINKEISIIREKIDELTKMGISYEEVIERIKK